MGIKNKLNDSAKMIELAMNKLEKLGCFLTFLQLFILTDGGKHPVILSI